MKTRTKTSKNTKMTKTTQPRRETTKAKTTSALVRKTPRLRCRRFLDQKFDLGQCILDEDLREFVEAHGVGLLDRLLARHACGDWGNVDAEHRAANEKALSCQEFIESVYVDNGITLCFLTEYDRGVTFIYRPTQTINAAAV
jgi:hypothetical protein